MTWWQRYLGKSTRGRIVALLRRGQLSVEELAESLELTDNAVRAHLATLEGEGLVHQAGIRRDGTVGKPATLYGLAPETSVLLSRAYAPVLAALVGELGERMPSTQLEELFRAVGRRLSSELRRDASLDERVRASAAMLTDLGAEADLVRTDAGYEIRGHGCPLGEAVASCPATCRALEELLTEVTGVAVEEQCDRSGPPSCRFLVPAASAAGLRPGGA